MSNNAKKSISATIGTLILMLIINHYFKPNTFDFIIGYMVTNLFIRLILLEQWFQVTLERKRIMNNFEQKLVEILSRLANGYIEPVEFCVSNSPSKTIGKVTQTVSFFYDIPEPDTDISGNKIPVKNDE